MVIKKTMLFLIIAFLAISTIAFGQSDEKKVEVFYFKANLACCKARACNTLQTDVDSVLIKYFANENIEFKVIRLADEANKDLVAKYEAKSQTVVIVTKEDENETSTDVSAILRDYAANHDKEKFEEDMKKKIDEALKK